jgi:hypothetical protein
MVGFFFVLESNYLKQDLTFLLSQFESDFLTCNPKVVVNEFCSPSTVNVILIPFVSQK